LDLPTIIPWACPRCALPMPVPTTCGRCLEDPPPYERCIAPFRYAYPLDALIKAVKFRGQLGFTAQLGALLANTLGDRLDTLPECLIPVPLHRLRLNERGYNQSLELARPLARQFKLPLNVKDCIRIRPTRPQTQLSATERQLNVRGAFKVRHRLEFRHVALIDDVITTGHTVAELTSQLIHSGVVQVDIWALARAVTP
jgi:ComF family protein